MDLAAYCVENPNAQLSVDSTIAKNCANVNTPGGSVTLNTGAAVGCDPSGSLTTGSVTATLENITDYTAKCTVSGGGFKCTVE